MHRASQLASKQRLQNYTLFHALPILSIIAGKDEKDNYTSAQPWDTPPDYTKALNFSSRLSFSAKE
jgi:hypothetical protein